ncbi:MAG TPA: hypothetical protein VLK84_10085 [Longimicrobium sp.]|nr:hypothetical protein [Longimicrobium sp.]
MQNTLRTTFRRKLIAVAAAPLLLGSVSAAAPLNSADLQWYSEGFFSNATFTTKVGHGIGYCDGDYIMTSGYQTSYSRIRYLTECP